MTHSSYANEEGLPDDNERLEFLGDAVLELVVSQEAYLRYPEADEGQLTTIRAMLVNERSLAAIAREMGLDAYLMLGKGEDMQGGRDRDSLLSDAFEALVGAVFLDAGFKPAQRVILDQLDNRWPDAPQSKKTKDHKSKLQEVTQARFRDRPVYVFAGSSGPEHEKIFESKITLPEGEEFVGSGTSMKKAEQDAARLAIEYLGDEPE